MWKDNVSLGHYEIASFMILLKLFDEHRPDLASWSTVLQQHLEDSEYMNETQAMAETDGCSRTGSGPLTHN